MEDWGTIEKGGEAWVVNREVALEAGMPGPLTEELVLFYTVSEENCAIQCSRAHLLEVLRALAPAQVKVLGVDTQLEVAVREGIGKTLH
ncbi:MAG: hypothetical protein KF834_04745 [Burkholderiales bacterium]|nr:hypothetical protein [Burkholderiales bacterium]